MTEKITIYHNPRCSKSRQTLQLIQEAGIEPDIVEYLKVPPDAAQLKSLLSQLDLEPRDLMRKGEAVYKELNLGNPDMTVDQLIQAMVENPILIERPLVSSAGRTIIGRPPENVQALLP